MSKPSRAGSKGEDILLVIEHVKHNNQKGSLYVTSQNLAFQSNGKDIFEPTYHFSEIKTQKISAEGKSKVQLQIVLQSDASHNFHFTNPKGQPDQLIERNSVKDMLQQLLPKFKKKISKELEEKSRILQTDRRMFQVYSDLVTTGIMTADEFWTKNAEKLRDDSGKSQQVGISAAFLADVTSQVDGCNSVRYNLTPEVIQSVFKTYPAVKRKHAEMVPDTISENEFWTKFFQSHYFHMARPIDKTSSKDNIFGDYPELDSKDSLVGVLRKGLDPSINIDELKDLGLDEDEGFGVEGRNATNEETSSQKISDRKRPANMTNAQLIQRFNLHSSRILATTENRHKHQSNTVSELVSQETTPSGSIVIEEPEESLILRPLLVSESELDLLRKIAGPTRLPLRLKKPDRYHQAPAKRKQASLDRTQSMSAQESFKMEVINLTKRRKIVISSKSAQQALLQIGGGKNRRQTGTELQLPPILMEEVRNAYASLTEILRHYWSCYPTTDRFLEEKLMRMMKSLEKFQAEILRKLADRAADEGQSPQIFAPLYDMIKAAEIRYTNQMKRST